MKLPENSKILMVGDRFYDIVGAHNAGIECAAVLFGYGNPEEFKKYKRKRCSMLWGNIQKEERLPSVFFF